MDNNNDNSIITQWNSLIGSSVLSMLEDWVHLCCFTSVALRLVELFITGSFCFCVGIADVMDTSLSR